MLPSVEIETKPILGELPNKFMSKEDRLALIALLHMVEPETMVEFGCNVGHTTKVILNNLASIKVYKGIDVHPGYVPAMKVQFDEVPKEAGKLVNGDPRFQLILRKKGSLDLGPDDIGMVDAALIDGDHGRVGVINDTHLARACVRSGGIIIWHDYHSGSVVDVKPVLEEFAATGSPIQHVANTWVAFERV